MKEEEGLESHSKGEARRAAGIRIAGKERERERETKTNREFLFAKNRLKVA